MQLRIFCVHIENSSLWAELVNKNRFISVRLVSEEDKSFTFDNFDQNISLIFDVKDGSHVRQ